MTERTTRAQRLALPLATFAIKALTEARGGCIRPVQLRRTSIDTGRIEQILVLCGATLAAACLACAERAKSLRGGAVPRRLASRRRACSRARSAG
jgi:hypothetical protein